ncbi:MAG: hypothetical protein AB1779_07115 [Candidatus Thermoplasmatota archaeon]
MVDRLLYEEDLEKNTLKRLQFGFLGTIGLIGAVGWFIVSVLFYRPQSLGVGIVLGAGITMLIVGLMYFGLYLILEAIFINKLQIYENFIKLPFDERRPKSVLLGGKQTILPFEEISAIYLNKNLDLPYVVIKDTKGESIPILKKKLGNLDKFEELIHNKVRIIKEKDWVKTTSLYVRSGECQPLPEKVDVSTKGIYFFYKKKEMFLHWENIKKVMPTQPLMEITLKDGNKIRFYKLKDDITAEIYQKFREFKRTHP